MFHVREVIITPQVEEHIWTKHQVTPEEVEEVYFADPGPLPQCGRDRSYVIFGRTEAGRYLLVVLYPRGRGIFSLATARDMDQTERRYYRRHRGR
jgi:uncharacterized DUF497 family protein